MKLSHVTVRIDSPGASDPPMVGMERSCSNDQHKDKPAAADIWALGIVLYEMVSGIRAPFRNPKMAEDGLKSVEAKFGIGVTCTPEIYAVLPIVNRCLEVSVLNRADIDELMGLVCSR